MLSGSNKISFSLHTLNKVISYPHKLSPSILNLVPIPLPIKPFATLSSSDVDVKGQNFFLFPIAYGIYLVLFGSFAYLTLQLIPLNKQFFLHFFNPLSARKNKYKYFATFLTPFFLFVATKLEFNNL